MPTTTQTKIRISAGTAAVLGLLPIKQLCAPTTAYFMVGQRCENGCLFCGQSKNSTTDALYLSRVTWPEFEIDEVLMRLEECNMERICFQVVNAENSQEKTIEFIKRIKEKKIKAKISVSINTFNEEFIKTIMALNIDNISLPLDAAAEEIFKKYKGRAWDQIWRVLNYVSKNYPAKAATHIIAGLGETQSQIIQLLYSLYLKKINTALFAFTPVKGTRVESNPPPELKYYRKIQLVNYLIKKDILREFNFAADEFIWTESIKELIMQDIKNKKYAFGEAFRTSGCTGCNRPYYNESPRGVIYNYPRQLSEEEYSEAARLAID